MLRNSFCGFLKITKENCCAKNEIDWFRDGTGELEPYQGTL